MNRIAIILALTASLALIPRGIEAASSTIDVTQPVQGVPYNAAPIRSNFGQAAADINALGSLNAGASPPSAPGLGALWLNTTSATYVLSLYDSVTSTWVPIASLDSINGIWEPPTGGGLPVTLAATDTTDLGSVPQTVETITGAGPIFSFGATAPAGSIKILAFTGATQIVYDAVAMILPGAADINTSAGDMAIATALGGGDWRIMYYNSAALIVAQGGTGRTSLTAHSLLIGETAAAVNFAVPGTLGYPVISQGPLADPIFGQLDLTVGVTGTLPVGNGGSGLATVPLHDLLIGAGTSPLTTLAPGTLAYPLVSLGASIDPHYALLTVPGGGTGLATIPVHGLLIGNAVSAITVLAPGTSAYPLLSQGPSADPAYGQLDLSGAGITGTAAIGHGGTGGTTLTNHAVLLGQATFPIGFAAPGTAGYPLLSAGAVFDPAFGQLDLTVGVTGVLPVANGGSGASAPTAHAVLLGEGASPFATTGPGTSSYPLISNGAADPAFQQLNLGGSGITGVLPNGNLPVSPTFTNLTLTGNETIAGTLGITGMTTTLGEFTMTGTNTERRFRTNSNSGTAAWIDYQTAGFERWLVGKDGDLESGGNAGSDYEIASFSDAGFAIGIPLTIRRKDGVIIMPNLPVAAAGLPSGSLWNNAGVVNVAP